MIEMTPGEAIDRYTILRLKDARGYDLTDKQRRELQDELYRYRMGIADYEIAFALMDQLYEINGAIWNLEADMRNGVVMTLEERGKRSIHIRDLNRTRVEIRGQIDRMFGAYAEPKVDHASAPK